MLNLNRQGTVLRYSLQDDAQAGVADVLRNIFGHTHQEAIPRGGFGQYPYMLNGTRSASSPRKTACIRDPGVNGTLSLLSRLLLVLYRFDHRYDVLHRYVGHNGMGRP